MNSASPRRPTSRDVRRPDRTLASLALAGTFLLAGCVSDGGGPAGTAIDTDGPPSEAMLQRVANSALPTGNAKVRFVDGVAYVTGNVKTAIDANAVVRALKGVDGVDRVEMHVRRGM